MTKQILLTCDTEVGELSGSVSNAFEVFIEGKVDRQTVGYQLINQIAANYSATVTHFVDVYPFECYGEQKFSGLCESILLSGHELALHTHPSGRFDKKRQFMHQYSYKEQAEIIAFGKQKIKDWAGIEVKSHRAGGYGANNDTLGALKENDIFIDSSFFANHPHCQIELKTINQISRVKGVLEVPVSVYKKFITYYPIMIRRMNYQKLDFRYGASISDILQTINEMPNGAVIVLFMHSFNFLNLPYNFKRQHYGKISVNSKLINDYALLLSAINQREDCQFATLQTLKNGPPVEDKVPVIKKSGSVMKKLITKINTVVGRRSHV
jgi:hypothetical protein